MNTSNLISSLNKENNGMCRSNTEFYNESEENFVICASIPRNKQVKVIKIYTVAKIIDYQFKRTNIYFNKNLAWFSFRNRMQGTIKRNRETFFQTAFCT